MEEPNFNCSIRVQATNANGGVEVVKKSWEERSFGSWNVEEALFYVQVQV